MVDHGRHGDRHERREVDYAEVVKCDFGWHSRGRISAIYGDDKRYAHLRYKHLRRLPHADRDALYALAQTMEFLSIWRGGKGIGGDADCSVRVVPGTGRTPHRHSGCRV